MYTRMVLSPLEKWVGNKGAYAISLVVGAIGFISTMFVTDQYVLFASYALIGGLILKFFCSGEQVGMLVVAGVLLLCGAAAVFLIKEKED